MNTNVTFIDHDGRILSIWHGPLSAVWQNMPSGSLYVEGQPPSLDGWRYDIANAIWLEASVVEAAS